MSGLTISPSSLDCSYAANPTLVSSSSGMASGLPASRCLTLPFSPSVVKSDMSEMCLLSCGWGSRAGAGAGVIWDDMVILTVFRRIEANFHCEEEEGGMGCGGNGGFGGPIVFCLEGFYTASSCYRRSSGGQQLSAVSPVSVSPWSNERFSTALSSPERQVSRDCCSSDNLRRRTNIVEGVGYHPRNPHAAIRKTRTDERGMEEAPHPPQAAGREFQHKVFSNLSRRVPVLRSLPSRLQGFSVGDRDTVPGRKASPRSGGWGECYFELGGLDLGSGAAEITLECRTCRDSSHKQVRGVPSAFDCGEATSM